MPAIPVNLPPRAPARAPPPGRFIARIGAKLLAINANTLANPLPLSIILFKFAKRAVVVSSNPLNASDSIILRLSCSHSLLNCSTFAPIESKYLAFACSAAPLLL